MRRAESVPVPYRGWNTRDALTEMQPVFAAVMDNWIPAANGIELRNGTRLHADNIEAHVTDGNVRIRKLIPYSNGVNDYFFAATSDRIFDVSGTGDIPSPSLSGLTNGNWSHTVFATLGDIRLVMCNGDDGVRTFNGSSWATSSMTGSPTPPATSFSGVASYQQRLWFIQGGTLDAWYMDNVKAFSGDMTSYPIGPYCNKGGSLVAMGTWSYDSGDGPNDYLAFFTSEGEAVVFAGTDPTDATLWSLIGVYNLSPPVGGMDAVKKIGGDLWITTQAGLLSVKDIMSGKAAIPAISDAIGPTWRQSTAAFGTAEGWELHWVPFAKHVFANVPSANNSFYQYLYVPEFDAWCRLVDIDATCWAMGASTGVAYFGTTEGKIFRAYLDYDDNENGIQTDVMFAHNRFGSPFIKNFTAARIAYTSQDTINLYASMNLDYDTSPPADVVTLEDGSIEGAAWDEAVWDESYWADAVFTRSVYAGLSGDGSIGALRLRSNSKFSKIGIHSVQLMLEDTYEL